MKQRSLVAEAVAAMLAADLDLPVPESFLVKVDAGFAATITDAEVKNLARGSLGMELRIKEAATGIFDPASRAAAATCTPSHCSGDSGL